MIKPDAKDSLIRQRARIRALISDYNSRLMFEPGMSPHIECYREIVDELEAILKVW
jgi:hypothetical protein